jgi:hypothetical protein
MLAAADLCAAQLLLPALEISWPILHRATVGPHMSLSCIAFPPALLLLLLLPLMLMCHCIARLQVPFRRVHLTNDTHFDLYDTSGPQVTLFLFR